MEKNSLHLMVLIFVQTELVNYHLPQPDSPPYHHLKKERLLHIYSLRQK